MCRAACRHTTCDVSVAAFLTACFQKSVCAHSAASLGRASHLQPSEKGSGISK